MKSEWINSLRKMKESIATRKRSLFLSIGFILGALLFFIYKEDFEKSRFMLIDQEMNLINQVEIDTNLFLPYLFKIRGEQFAFLYLISKMKPREILEDISCILFGFIFGFFQTIAVYRYGLKGVLLVGALLFPQIMFYLSIFQILFHKSYEKRAYYSWKGRMSECIPYLIRGVLMVSLFICGVICECYVNTIILHKVSYLF